MLGLTNREYQQTRSAQPWCRAASANVEEPLPPLLRSCRQQGAGALGHRYPRPSLQVHVVEPGLWDLVAAPSASHQAAPASLEKKQDKICERGGRGVPLSRAKEAARGTRGGARQCAKGSSPLRTEELALA
jgi:hypothetical protein